MAGPEQSGTPILFLAELDIFSEIGGTPEHFGNFLLETRYISVP